MIPFKRYLPFLMILLLVLCFALPAAAQRGQALCQTATGDDPEVDDTPCVEFSSRLWVSDPNHGIEEDMIIGIGSADRTLTNAELDALATTRIKLVDAPGAGKYLFIDWIALVKTDADGVPTSPQPGQAWLAVGVASETGTVLPSGPAYPVFQFAGGNPGQLWQAGNYVRRYISGGGALGIGQESAADTPIVVGVIVGTNMPSEWTNITDELDDSVTLRIIVRYRVIDTGDPF